MQTMNNSPYLSAMCALVIIVSLVLGCGRFGRQSAGGAADLIKEPIPFVDPAEPFPAISTSLIDALISEVPELSKYRDEILNAEHSAINGLLEDVRANSHAAKGNFNDTALGSVSLPGPASLRQMPSHYDTTTERGQRTADSSVHLRSTQAALAAASVPSSSVFTGVALAKIIGYQHAMFSPDYGKIKDADRGQSETRPIKDRADTVVATRTTSISKTDGIVSSELSTKIYMPIFELDSNSRVNLTGNQCPTSEGKLDLTIEYSSNGRAGSSGTVVYDKTISARIKASVNNEAELAGIDFDLKQATRSTAGGRQVNVETSQSGQGGTGSYEDIKFGDVRIDRANSQATSADQSISDDGLKEAYRLGQGVLESAMGRWKGGGCVKIEANSPGTVQPSSTTAIPVTVRHEWDRSEVPSKLDVVLKGEKSVSPTSIAKTTGTLTYVAPGERNRKATIGLTATSRRGRATLDLTASTGSNPYRVDGKSHGASFTGEICGLDKPFTIYVDSITGSWPMGFTPSSELAGRMDGSIEANGCTLTGGGPYTISIGEDGSGTITFTYNSTATCPGVPSRTTSKTSTLPLKPAPDLSCT